MSIENLWGDLSDILDFEKETALSILRNQADYLKEMTKGKLSGNLTIKREITSALESRFDRGELPHQPIVTNFYIVAPRLDFYHYKLLSLVTNVVDENFHLVVYNTGSTYQGETVEEFKDTLQGILTSENITTIIKNLLAQVTSYE